MVKVEVRSGFRGQLRYLRKGYEPRRVKVLFVAELPPPQSGHALNYFYNPVFASNRLRKYMKEALERVSLIDAAEDDREQLGPLALLVRSQLVRLQSLLLCPSRYFSLLM